MNFAYGVDTGWLSQLESKGIRWVDASGSERDPYVLMKDMGADSVRLRVFVEPPRSAYWQKRDGSICMLGYCDKDSVIAAAKRVKDNGMRLMIDFHYSDHFADPEYQEIPSDWLVCTPEMMADKIAEHTKDVLLAMKARGITPDWVQVGNEINPGILLPLGSLEEHPDRLVEYLNAGYDAVKSVDDSIQVITHVAGLQCHEMTLPFLDNFFDRGGRTDIAGFSYYPYWHGGARGADELYKYMRGYVEKYAKPIMVVEVGEFEDDPKLSYETIDNAIKALKRLPDDMGLGIFYWEPETGRMHLPDEYPLGAASKVDDNTLRFTEALTAYRDNIYYSDSI